MECNGISRECLLVSLGKVLQIFNGMECQTLHFFSATRDCTYSLQIKPLFLQMLEFKRAGICTFFLYLTRDILR